MSIGLGIAIYTALVAVISSLMVYYFGVMYPREEQELRSKK